MDISQLYRRNTFSTGKCARLNAGYSTFKIHSSSNICRSTPTDGGPTVGCFARSRFPHPQHRFSPNAQHGQHVSIHGSSMATVASKLGTSVQRCPGLLKPWIATTNSAPSLAPCNSSVRTYLTAEEAEARFREFTEQAEEAEARLEEAEARVDEAEARARIAEARAEVAAQKAKEDYFVGEAMTRALKAEERCHDAEARVADLEDELIEVRFRADAAEERVREAEVRAALAEARLRVTEERLIELQDRVAEELRARIAAETVLAGLAAR